MPAKKSAKKKATKKTAKKAAAKSTKKKAAKKTAKKAAKKASRRRKPEDILVSPMFGEAYQLKKNEEYMNDKMQAHFRNILNLWKKELMEEVDRTMGHLKDEAANFPDPNDRATQETEFSLELRTRDRERKLIKKIDESLELLDNGDYGFCEACGVEIGIRRLEARPTATQCIDCKTLDEIREKQMG
jgi:DnaK suppressor protein